MDREAHLALHAVEHHAQEGVRGDSCHLPADTRDGHERANGVLLEPPVELGPGQGQVAPGIVQQPQVVLPLLRLVGGELVP